MPSTLQPFVPWLAWTAVAAVLLGGYARWLDSRNGADGVARLGRAVRLGLPAAGAVAYVPAVPAVRRLRDLDLPTTRVVVRLSRYLAVFWVASVSLVTVLTPPLAARTDRLRDRLDGDPEV